MGKIKKNAQTKMEIMFAIRHVLAGFSSSSGSRSCSPSRLVPT